MKKTVERMKEQSSNAFCKSVYQMMIDELSLGDVENVVTPSFLSIVNFGYDIFSFMTIKEYKLALEFEDERTSQ
jgi:hypothetical protein